MEIRNTKAREIILNILKNSKTPLTADDIANKTRKNNINLSTIYRSLNTFIKGSVVKKDISNIDKKAYYSYISKVHYHILECSKCHKQIRIDYCPFEPIEESLYDKFGFKVDDENSIIYGTCKDCLKKEQR